MRLLHVTVAILGLLSVGHSAPATNCESLTQKIDIQSRDQLLGKWILIAETLTMPGTSMLTKKFVDNAYVTMNAAPESDTLYFHQSQKTFGSCMTYRGKLTMANNTLFMEKPYKATEVLLTTGCPDCLVILGNFTLGQTYYQSLQFMSRRRELTTPELDEFKKQVDCLNLPAAAFLDPQTVLCSQEADQNTENTDVTQLLNGEKASQMFGMLESLMNNENGLLDFINTISSNVGKITSY